MHEMVELMHAWRWVCPTCAGENYVPSVPVEPSDEDREDIAEATGQQPYEVQTGDWHTQPEEVECGHCNAEFKVVPPE